MPILVSCSVQGGPVSSSSASARPGDSLLLTASDADGGTSPTGQWTKGGTGISGATDSAFTFVMTRSAGSGAAPSDPAGPGVYSFTAADHTASNALTVTRTSLLSRLPAFLRRHRPSTLTVGVIAGYIILSVVLLVAGDGHAGHRLFDSPSWITFRSSVFAAATVAVFLFIVNRLGDPATQKGGLYSLFVGADLRASTSKTQYMVWTFVVGSAVAYIAARSLIAGTSFICTAGVSHNCISDSNWDDYLILLGLPVTAAILAKGIVSYQVQNGTVQKTPSSTDPSLVQLGTDDQGTAQIADIQYLLFNIIAVIYVIAGFLHTGSLPTIPNLLLGLTSTSASAYVLNKAIQSNKPTISSVVPTVIRPGQKVTISGQNLFPDPTRPAADTVVKIGGVLATQITPSSDHQSLTAIAPNDMSTDNATVQVVTSANIETDSYSIIIASLSIQGWNAAAPSTADAPVTGQVVVPALRGSDAASTDITLTADDVVLSGITVNDAVVGFQFNPAGRAQVVLGIGWRGITSAPVTLALAL